MTPLDGTIAEYAWLLPMLPLLGAIINGFLSIAPRLGGAGLIGTVSERELAADASHVRTNTIVSVVASGVMIAAFAVAVAIFVAMQGAGLKAPFVRTYARWMPVGTLSIDWGIQIDQLSILMALVVTGVGALIHLFSIGYMKTDPGYARYLIRDTRGTSRISICSSRSCLRWCSGRAIRSCLSGGKVWGCVPTCSSDSGSRSAPTPTRVRRPS
jgi:hypothetical protein